MEEFADHNFKSDERGRKLVKQVENTVGKGEITRYEQFLLFPQCFQKASFPGSSKDVIVWDRVKGGYLDFSHLTELKKYISLKFIDIVEKGEIAHLQPELIWERVKRAELTVYKTTKL